MDEVKQQTRPIAGPARIGKLKTAVLDAAVFEHICAVNVPTGRSKQRTALSHRASARTALST